MPRAPAAASFPAAHSPKRGMATEGLVSGDTAAGPGILKQRPGYPIRLAACPRRGSLHRLLISRYDQEGNRTRTGVKVQREEEEISALIAVPERVLPLLRERFGAAKIGTFGSTA